MVDFTSMDFRLTDKRAARMADAGQVYNTLRETYFQAKHLQALIQRFSVDQDFSDTFDELSSSDGFDGGAIASQMLYDINQLVTAWESNAAKRDLLLLPPLT